MQRLSAEGRHLADKQQVPQGAGLAQFMKLSRKPREMFHVNHGARSNVRLQHFLRIAKGHRA